MRRYSDLDPNPEEYYDGDNECGCHNDDFITHYVEKYNVWFVLCPCSELYNEYKAKEVA